MWSNESTVPIKPMSTGLPANKETPVCDATDRVLSAVVRVTFDVVFGFALIPVFPWWSDLFHRVVGVARACSIDSLGLRGGFVFALLVLIEDALCV